MTRSDQPAVDEHNRSDHATNETKADENVTAVAEIKRLRAEIKRLRSVVVLCPRCQETNNDTN